MTTAEVTLAGESEPGARLTVNGGYVPVGDNGALHAPRCTRVARATTRSRSPPSTRPATAPSAAAASSTARRRGRRSPSTRRLPRDAEGRLLTPGRRDRRRRHLRRRRGRAAAGARRGRRAGGAGAGRRRRRLPLHRAGVGGGHRPSGSRSSARTAGSRVARDFVGAPGRDAARDPARRAAAGRHRERLARPRGQRRGRRRGHRQRRARPGSPTAASTPRRRWRRGRTASRSSRRTRSATSRSSGSRPSTTSTRRRSCRRRPSRPDGDGGPIEIVVEARDGSGLRQAAPFILTVGGTERRGFLRCDSAAGTCRETLPPEPGALALVEVAVEDYAGNVAKRQPVSRGRARGGDRCDCWPGRLLLVRAGSRRRPGPQPAPLMVVYGPEAPTREGDVDHVERLFLSLPADLPDRLYLRVFDPEPAGAHDTRYGRSADADRDALPALGRRGRLHAARRCRPRSPTARRRRAGPRPPRPRRRPGDRRAPLRPGEPDRRRLGDAGALHRRRRRAGRRAAPTSGST